VLLRLALLHGLGDDLFVSGFLNFESFMYWDKDCFGGGIYPKMPFELNYTSNMSYCNFLDLAIN